MMMLAGIMYWCVFFVLHMIVSLMLYLMGG